VADYFLEIVFSEMTDEVWIAVSKLCCQQGSGKLGLAGGSWCLCPPSAGFCTRMRAVSDELLFVSTGHMSSDERIFF